MNTVKSEKLDTGCAKSRLSRSPSTSCEFIIIINLCFPGRSAAAGAQGAARGRDRRRGVRGARQRVHALRGGHPGEDRAGRPGPRRAGAL